MNLKAVELQELNSLLKDSPLDIPNLRKSVNSTGSNYKWLQKHITKRNSDIEPRLVELLRLKKPQEA